MKTSERIILTLLIATMTLGGMSFIKACGGQSRAMAEGLHEIGGGVSDHGQLVGLTDDDHTAYYKRNEQATFSNVTTGKAVLSGMLRVASAGSFSAALFKSTDNTVFFDVDAFTNRLSYIRWLENGTENWSMYSRGNDDTLRISPRFHGAARHPSWIYYPHNNTVLKLVTATGVNTAEISKFELYSTGGYTANGNSTINGTLTVSGAVSSLYEGLPYNHILRYGALANVTTSAAQLANNAALKACEAANGIVNFDGPYEFHFTCWTTVYGYENKGPANRSTAAIRWATLCPHGSADQAIYFKFPSGTYPGVRKAINGHIDGQYGAVKGGIKAYRGYNWEIRGNMIEKFNTNSSINLWLLDCTGGTVSNNVIGNSTGTGTEGVRFESDAINSGNFTFLSNSTDPFDALTYAYVQKEVAVIDSVNLIGNHWGAKGPAAVVEGGACNFIGNHFETSCDLGDSVIQIGSQTSSTRVDVVDGFFGGTTTESVTNIFDCVSTPFLGSLTMVGKPTVYGRKDDAGGGKLFNDPYEKCHFTMEHGPHYLGTTPTPAFTPTSRRFGNVTSLMFVSTANPVAEIAFSNQTTANNTWTTMKYGTEVLDTKSMINPGALDRVSITQPGYYFLSIEGEFEPNATGERWVRLVAHPSDWNIINDKKNANATSNYPFAYSTFYNFTTATQYVTLDLRQSSGGNLEVCRASGRFGRIKAYRLP